MWKILSGAQREKIWSSSDIPSPPCTYSPGSSNDADEFELEIDSIEDEDEEEEMSVSSIYESNELYSSIVDSITSLLKLTILIQKSTQKNKFLKSSTSKNYETQFDILHVQARFPFAFQNWSLIERLGKANAQRRQWLLYTKNHREKLGEKMDPPKNDISSTASNYGMPANLHAEYTLERRSTAPTERSRGLATELSATTASSYAYPKRKDTEQEEKSEADFSETTYSTTRFGDSDQETHLVPQPPAESANENPFECPYCFKIRTIEDRRSWTYVTLWKLFLIRYIADIEN